MSTYKKLIDKYEVNVYPKRDVVIVKGSGAKVWDENGKEYIDCTVGIGVATIGHCNPKVSEAIAEQSKTLITNPGIFYNDKRALMLEKLISISPKSLTKAFITNSGTEAVEAAIKFARITTGKTDFISAMRGFHGRTMGALSATHKEEYRTSFEPLVPGFTFVAFNKIDKLKEAITEKTAGIILEVVQGEGGINIGDKEYFDEVRKICDENKIILIIDEIQSGFCRTGKMFACEHFDIQPDIMTVAKAIAGGFPVGAAICSDKIDIPTGKHGSTFGGNPLGAAASIAAIDFMLENNLAKQAEEKGNYFVSKFDVDKLSKVRGIRNLGLMIGIELKEKVQPYLVELMEKGILAMPAGKTILRLLPPAVISYEDLDKVAEVLNDMLK
ncbi:MAG: acetylornithine/succinylornithine family transaminase [Ignavibacteriales bacterium]|nr:acetylornithine/succinylornithine family transaminase [Ignavibacteriales bacterium]